MVINSGSGVIESATVFDTYKDSSSLNEFILKAVPDGRIVAVACKDYNFKALLPKAKKWLMDMGSKSI